MGETTLEFAFAYDADQGARPYQEDSVEARRANGQEPGDPVLAVLADGMGGHVAGAKASKIAIERYANTFLSDRGTIAELLERSLNAANDGISSEVSRDPGLKGMGCTLVAAYAGQEGLRWASVGDSLLLLYRNGQIHRLNEDHSLVPVLEKLTSPEEARNDPRRHVLRSALTGDPIPLLEIQSSPKELLPGDWVILASDGLETLSEDEIAAIIGRLHRSAKPADAVRDLLAEVRRKAVPHQDNVSIIAIKATDPHAEDKQALFPPVSSEVSETIPLSRVPERGSIPGKAWPNLAFAFNGEPALKARVLPATFLLVVLAAFLASKAFLGGGKEAAPRHDLRPAETPRDKSTAASEDKGAEIPEDKLMSLPGEGPANQPRYPVEPSKSCGIVLKIQVELKRLGCFPPDLPLSNRRGPVTQGAIKKFMEASRFPMNEQPSPKMLSILRGIKDPVCPEPFRPKQSAPKPLIWSSLSRNANQPDNGPQHTGHKPPDAPPPDAAKQD